MEKNLRPFVAELIGTFAFVFVGAGTVCMSDLYFGGQPQSYVLGIALAQGCMFAAALAATVHVSGGYLNPAITLMLWVFKRLDGNRAMWLVAAQLLGGFLAGLVLRLMFATDTVLVPARFGTPHLRLEAFGAASFLQALVSGVGIEFILTFVLAFAIYGALLDPRAPQLGVLGPGLALTALTLLGYPLTGAAANPARWLGPALWEVTLQQDAFRDHAVYWIGPIFGALLAGLVYEYVILPAADARSPATEDLVTSTLFKAKK